MLQPDTRSLRSAVSLFGRHFHPLLFLFSLLLAACGGKKEAMPPSLNDPFGQAVTVETILAEKKPIEGEELLLTGSLVANEAAEVYSEESGIVTSIRFQEGSKVNKGQVLATINNAELSAQMSSLKSELQLAKDVESRQRRLLEIGGISQQQFESAANNRVAVEARIQELQARMAKFNVRAPFAGTIGLRYVSQGAYISPTTRIASLVDVDPIKLDFSVPGEQYNEVKMGDTVDFRAEGQTEFHPALVYAMEPIIDAATRSLLVRARANNSDGRLMPGAFAEVKLRVGKGRRSIMVPSEAIVMERDSQHVYIVENGKASLKHITTGIRRSEEVEVLSGISNGDTIVTRGILLLRDGTPVKATPAQTSTADMIEATPVEEAGR